MNTTCPAVAGNGTNCALAGVASKAVGMRKVALLRSRLSFSEDLPNLPCEQTIVVILLQHFQVHLAQRVRADQLQKLIKGGVGRETGRKAPPVDSAQRSKMHRPVPVADLSVLLAMSMMLKDSLSHIALLPRSGVLNSPVFSRASLRLGFRNVQRRSKEKTPKRSPNCVEGLGSFESCNLARELPTGAPTVFCGGASFFFG